VDGVLVVCPRGQGNLRPSSRVVPLPPARGGRPRFTASARDESEMPKALLCVIEALLCGMMRQSAANFICALHARPKYKQTSDGVTAVRRRYMPAATTVAGGFGSRMIEGFSDPDDLNPRLRHGRPMRSRQR